MGVLTKVTRVLRKEILAGEGLATTRKLEGWYGVITSILAASFEWTEKRENLFGLEKGRIKYLKIKITE